MDILDQGQKIAVAIPGALLKMPVFGVNLKADTLQGNLNPEGTLLVFLRHFGCLFCREMVADLRHHSAADGERDRILFFYQGTVPEGREFFGNHWPSARGIADQPLKFYEGFGVPKATMAQAFSPTVWRSGIRTWSRGYRPGLPQGDIRQMPGLMWVQAGKIVWRHDFAHAGDHPNLSKMPWLPLQPSGAA